MHTLEKRFSIFHQSKKAKHNFMYIVLRIKNNFLSFTSLHELAMSSSGLPTSTPLIYTSYPVVKTSPDPCKIIIGLKHFGTVTD